MSPLLLHNLPSLPSLLCLQIKQDLSGSSMEPLAYVVISTLAATPTPQLGSPLHEEMKKGSLLWVKTKAPFNTITHTHTHMHACTRTNTQLFITKGIASQKCVGLGEKELGASLGCLDTGNLSHRVEGFNNKINDPTPLCDWSVHRKIRLKASTTSKESEHKRSRYIVNNLLVFLCKG